MITRDYWGGEGCPTKKWLRNMWMEDIEKYFLIKEMLAALYIFAQKL